MKQCRLEVGLDEEKTKYVEVAESISGRIQEFFPDRRNCILFLVEYNMHAYSPTSDNHIVCESVGADECIGNNHSAIYDDVYKGAQFYFKMGHIDDLYRTEERFTIIREHFGDFDIAVKHMGKDQFDDKEIWGDDRDYREYRTKIRKDQAEFRKSLGVNEIYHMHGIERKRNHYMQFMKLANSLDTVIPYFPGDGDYAIVIPVIKLYHYNKVIGYRNILPHIYTHNDSQEMKTIKRRLFYGMFSVNGNDMWFGYEIVDVFKVIDTQPGYIELTAKSIELPAECKVFLHIVNTEGICR